MLLRVSRSHGFVARSHRFFSSKHFVRRPHTTTSSSKEPRNSVSEPTSLKPVTRIQHGHATTTTTTSDSWGRILLLDLVLLGLAAKNVISIAVKESLASIPSPSRLSRSTHSWMSESNAATKISDSNVANKASDSFYPSKFAPDNVINNFESRNDHEALIKEELIQEPQPVPTNNQTALESGLGPAVNENINTMDSLENNSNNNKVNPVENSISNTQELSRDRKSNLKASSVPSTRIGRLFQYGGIYLIQLNSK
jgi:hypothetical protein